MQPRSNQKTANLVDIIKACQNAIDILNNLTQKPSLDPIEKRRFVRAFANLGESLTFFRDSSTDSHGLIQSMMSLKSMSNQSLVNGFTAHRNILLHQYAYEQQWGEGGKFNRAILFAKSKLDILTKSLEKLSSSMSETEPMKKEQLQTTSGSLTSSTPQTLSMTNKKEDSNAVETATATRGILPTPKNTLPYSIFDYAIFGKKEIQNLDSLLAYAKINNNELLSPNNLDSCFSANRLLKPAIFNCIENI